ncbi:hypothetical protein ACA910_018083 [Epithemia clementina (nom. ined.)]
MTSIITTTNPLRDDDVLPVLLEQLDSLQTHREFGHWKEAFLDRLEGQYLDPAGLTAAQQRYRQLGTYMGQLVTTVKALEQLQRRGKLNDQTVSVKAHQTISKLNETMKLASTQLRQLIPGTADEVTTYGFSKFHMGAVLVRDHFGEYDRLYLCDQILRHLHRTLASIVDHQVLDEMKRFGVQLENFCAIMADLGLYEAMVKCHQLKVDEIAASSGDEKQVPKKPSSSPPPPKPEQQPQSQPPVVRKPKVLKTSPESDDSSNTEEDDKFEYDNISLSEHSIYSLGKDEKIAFDGDTSVSKMNHSFNSYYLGDPNQWRIAPKRGDKGGGGGDDRSVCSASSSLRSPSRKNKASSNIGSSPKKTTTTASQSSPPSLAEEGSVKTASSTLNDDETSKSSRTSTSPRQKQKQKQQQRQQSQPQQQPQQEPPKKKKKKKLQQLSKLPKQQQPQQPQDSHHPGDQDDKYHNDSDEDDNRTLGSTTSSVCRSLRPGVFRGASYMASPDEMQAMMKNEGGGAAATLAQKPTEEPRPQRGVSRAKSSYKKNNASDNNNGESASAASSQPPPPSRPKASMRPGVFRGASYMQPSDDDDNNDDDHSRRRNDAASNLQALASATVRPSSNVDSKKNSRSSNPASPPAPRSKESMRPGVFRGASYMQPSSNANNDDDDDDDDDDDRRPQPQEDDDDDEDDDHHQIHVAPASLRPGMFRGGSYDGESTSDEDAPAAHDDDPKPTKKGEQAPRRRGGKRPSQPSPPRPQQQQNNISIATNSDNNSVTSKNSRKTPWNPKKESSSNGKKLNPTTDPSYSSPVGKKAPVDPYAKEEASPPPRVKEFDLRLGRTGGSGGTTNGVVQRAEVREISSPSVRTHKSLDDDGSYRYESPMPRPQAKKFNLHLGSPNKNGTNTKHGAFQANYPDKAFPDRQRLPPQRDDSIHEYPMPKPVVKKFEIGVARNPPRSPRGLGRPYTSDEEENAPCLETEDTDDDDDDDDDESARRRRFNRNKHLPDRGDSDDEENAEGRDPNLNRKGGIVRPGENGEDAAAGEGEGAADGEPQDWEGDMDDSYHRRRFNRNKHLPDRGDSMMTKMPRVVTLT